MRSLAKLTWVEIKLFTREPLTIVFSLVFPLVVLFVLVQVFGNDPNPDLYRGFGATDFYVPAYIGLVISSIGLFGLPVVLAGYRERGVLRRFRASSVPVWSVLGAQVIVGFVIAAVSSLLLAGVAAIAYDLNAPDSPVGVMGAFLLGTLSFAALGVLLGALLPTARTAQGAGLVLFFVMMLISGAGPPRELLGTAMQRVGDALPLTHVITLLQDPWLGLGWNVNEMLIVTGILVASVLLTLRFFRWE